MKKSLAMLLVLALTMSLVACVPAPTQPGTQPGTKPQGSTPEGSTPAGPVEYEDPFKDITDYDELSAAVYDLVLGDFYEGMATTILLPGFDANRVWEHLAAHYEGQKLVSVAPLGGDESVLYASTFAGKDSMRITVSGHENQTMVTALFDNLGKGASGAAIQNMNILLGVDEATAAEEACKIEHDISDRTFEKIKAHFLDKLGDSQTAE